MGVRNMEIEVYHRHGRGALAVDDLPSFGRQHQRRGGCQGIYRYDRSPARNRIRFPMALYALGSLTAQKTEANQAGAQ